jgi:ABC-type multidrug transport system fused ATPase/permease subunit
VVLVQALMTFLALRTSAVFGQEVLANAREYVVRTVLALPLGRVESASSGDLVTRVTRDVGTMAQTIRFGLPETVIAIITTLLTVAAMLLNSPLLTLPLLAVAPLLIVAARRYLKRAPQGYITEGGTYSVINSTLTETVEGARTVEALGLQGKRIEQFDVDIDVSAQAERYTMTLRNILFLLLGFVYDLPPLLVLIIGAVGYVNGWVTLGQITAAVLYVQALVEPLQRLIRMLDKLQVGIASTSRLLGIASVPQDREAGEERTGRQPAGRRDLRFAYRSGVDVLHGVDLALRPGERLAIVGPSGSGKSTLGRLLSGINGPRTGSVTVGGVELTALPLPVLRTEVALVTQEHHVFVGSVRDNIILAREDSPDEVVIEALRTVDAWDWVSRLPGSWTPCWGRGSTS